MKRKERQSDLYQFQLVLERSDHLLACVLIIEGSFQISLR